MHRVRLLSLVFIAVVLLNTVPGAVWAGQAVERSEEILPDPTKKYDLDYIYIFYDPADELMCSIAESVHEVLSFRLQNIIMIPVDSYDILNFYLLDEPWIAVYALRSSLKNVVFPDRNMTWYKFYQVLSEHRSTRHVVGMGNTLSMAQHIGPTEPNIRHTDAEQIDGLVVILYNLWEIQEALSQRSEASSDYRRAHEDIQTMALKIYGDNFDMFFKRTVDPQNPIGEIDEKAREERTKKMWEQHAPTIEKTYYHMSEEGQLEELTEEELPEDFTPPIKLSSAAELAADDFVLGEIPLLSALRGPIGEIIDVLLSVLGGSGSTIISVPSDLIETIQSLFSVIKPIIGIVSDFDAESPLKSVVNALANEFPFMAQFKDYLNIILKALFNFRGDLGSILEIVGDLIEVLLPDSVPDMLKSFIGQMLDAEDGLWNAISSLVTGEKGVFDAIFSFFTTNTLESLLNKTLSATIGLLPSEVSALLPRVVTFTKSIVSFMTSGNFMDFIQQVGTELLSSILSVAGLEDVVDKVMSFIHMAMSVVDLVDKFDTTSLIDLAKGMLEEIVGGSNIPGGVEALAKELFSVIKTFQEGASSDFTGFASQIGSILESGITGVSEDVRNIVRDTISLVSGFFVSGFNKNQLPDIFEIAQDIANEFLGSGATLSRPSIRP